MLLATCSTWALLTFPSNPRRSRPIFNLSSSSNSGNPDCNLGPRKSKSPEWLRYLQLKQVFFQRQAFPTASLSCGEAGNGRFLRGDRTFTGAGASSVGGSCHCHAQAETGGVFRVHGGAEQGRCCEYFCLRTVENLVNFQFVLCKF